MVLLLSVDGLSALHPLQSKFCSLHRQLSAQHLPDFWLHIIQGSSALLICMQVAAFGDVVSVSTDDIPQEVLDKEFEIEMGKDDILSKPEDKR